MTERWKAPKLDPFVEMVSLERRKFTLKNGYAPDWSDMTAMAIKLLARQHRAFVALVKRCQCDPEDGAAVEAGYAQAKHDILAALAKQGGGKK